MNFKLRREPSSGGEGPAEPIGVQVQLLQSRHAAPLSGQRARQSVLVEEQEGQTRETAQLWEQRAGSRLVRRDSTLKVVSCE